MGRRTKTSKISLNADGTASVELTRGHIAIIDQSDIPLVSSYKWHSRPSRGTSYAVRNVRNTDGVFVGRGMHRDIAGIGDYDGTTSIDHIDRDGLNNRRSNLRVANATLQKLNQCVRQDNTSGANGIHMRPWGKWQARIAVGGQRFSLGHFDTYGEAKRCYDAVRRVVGALVDTLVPSIDQQQEEAA
jgi:hypothetical protein